MAFRDLDVGVLRVFEAAGRLGSLTAAAEALGLSQPAVSYQIRRLEEELGVALFVRGHRGSRLSPAGETLYRAAAAAVRDVDAVVRDLRRQARSPVVRLFTDYGFASFWLMPRVAAFRRAQPGIEVHIVASPFVDTGPEGFVDASVLFGAAADFPPGARLLIPEQVFPVCAPGFLRRHGPLAEPSAIAAAPLLHLDSTPRPRWYGWRDWFAAFGIDRRHSGSDLALNTYPMVVQAMLAEQGVGLGWTGLVDGHLADGTLVRVGAPLVRPDRGYFLLRSADRHGPAAVLEDWILAAAEGDA
ncbi:LysR family transcriptional regulator [Methylobrevis albus]|uniref:LysR family transcriptional regulator n=1 Tax=Methylobrevis albus TaxID=2793297 RepID=A0A931I264_9HYPH|nr:LysR family transcriptional regulator [Methylobrevis albus]MBH0238049.1 LysR family transcriptional regulator [Methylobrevis albus]